MPTVKLLERSRTLKETIEKSEHYYLHEIAARNFNSLLDESRCHLGDKISHIEKIPSPNYSAVKLERISKHKLLTEVDKLIMLLEASLP